LFAFLNIALAFTALMAFVGCLLLLVVGVFFACLWIIPGRPRQWGLNWFEALIGLVLQSFLAMLVFGTALTLTTAVFSLSGTVGWLPVSGLAIAVLIVAFRLRRLLDNLTTMMRPGAGSVMLGGLARKGAMGAVRRIMGAMSSRGAAPALADRARERLGTTEAGSQRVTSVRVYRQAPAASSLTRGTAGGSPYELAAGTGSRRGEGSGASGGGGSGGSTAAFQTRTGSASSQSGTVSGPSLARAKANSRSEPARTIAVSAANVAPTSGSVLSPPRTSSNNGAVGRHPRRQPPADVSDARYEPRPQAHSASLRDGPPKGQRSRRRPTAQQQRRFREYSSVTKDGVTMFVPTRR
jgi:hypothetical protein